MISRIDPVPVDRPSFLRSDRYTDLDSLTADLAVVGVPYTTPCDLAHSRAACSPAPAALREQSLRFVGSLHNYDFEFGGDLFAGRPIGIVDCGDVAMTPGRYEENSRAATAVIGALLARGAVPLILGGDRAAAIPALRAFGGYGPLCAVGIGAELDWRDEVNGAGESLSSAMRRAAELPWVTSMLQVGLRGVGSARQREVDDARAFGSILVRAEAVHELGVEEVLARHSHTGNYFVCLDAGALDPSIAPGVEDPAFGGLTYFEATNLLRGIAAKGKVVGMACTGVVPTRDTNDMTSLLSVRLALNLAGAMTHAGQFDRAPAAARRDDGATTVVEPELVGNRSSR